MEDYAPVAKYSPPRSFQEPDAPLGSSSASPAHFHQRSFQFHPELYQTISQIDTSAPAHLDKDGGDQNSSLSPSIPQQTALAALQGYDNATILAWLTGIRNFKLGGQNWFQPNCLPSQQLEAISALKDCADSLVTAWLDSVRCDDFKFLDNRYGTNPHPVQRAAVASTRDTWQGSSNTSRSSSSSFGYSTSSYDRYTSPSTQRSSWSRGTFPELSRDTSSIDESAATPPVGGAHTHWCFVCEHPRRFATCDGWKRHMKEHETRYPCMPHGCKTYTAHGSECVLCGLLNPDEQHFGMHRVVSCSSKSLAARSYTRKCHLINHLKTHGISDGSALAEEWRDTLDKKFFSCGFCIACFQTHTGQLNHIDSTHFKKHEHISEWNGNRLILGLLLQPRVKECWQRLLTLNGPRNELGFRWSPVKVKSLQLRLGKSEESPEDLALAAFNESTYDWTPETQLGSLPNTGFPNPVMTVDHHMPVFQPQDHPPRIGFTLHQSSPYANGMVNTPSQLNCPQWRTNSADQHSPGVFYTAHTQHLNNESQDTTTTNIPLGFQDRQPGFSSDSGNSWPSPQGFLHALSNSSIANSWDVFGDHTAISSTMTPDGHWQTSPSHNPSVDDSGNQQNNGASRTRTNNTSQFTNLGLDDPSSLYSQATSFVGHNGPCSPPRRLIKQPSRTKLKAYYDINTEADIDFDMDALQNFMCDDQSTRSERRGR